ncbi:MAG: LssY C-terminal domain-containing protein [Lysobacterales bacterium]
MIRKVSATIFSVLFQAVSGWTFCDAQAKNTCNKYRVDNRSVRCQWHASYDLFNNLTRSGWSFAHRVSPKSVKRMMGSAVHKEACPVAPVSSLYVFDDKQNFALQSARNDISQRNHMRFWMAPFTCQQQQVWHAHLRVIFVQGAVKGSFFQRF